MNMCPCGSNKQLSLCCEPFIVGKEIPAMPEELMRSRYTAFTQANMDYIASTMKGGVLNDFDPKTAKIWAENAKWLGLEIINVSPLTEENTKGYVEFIASYLLKNRQEKIHEMSEFRFEDNRWFYVDGEMVTSDQKENKMTKVGRNDACICGSGKKFKKCCG